MVKLVFAMDHHYTGTKTVSGALHKVNKEFKKVSKSLTSDDTFRSFMDKTTSALTFDGVKKAVLKATSFEHGPPKEKHVQTLIQECQYNNSPELLQELAGRLHNKDATVVLKALMVFHRLLSDSPRSANMYKACYALRNEFNVRRFLDESTHESMQASRMVRHYALYLEEKIHAFKKTRFDYERHSSDSSEHIDSLSTDQLIIDVEAMMLLLDAGYSCSFRENSVVHPTSIAAFSIVFKDVRVLYQSLNKAILRLLDNYFELPKAIAEKILTLYKMFLDHNKKISNVFDDARELLGHEKVELSVPPESFLESLEKYLENDDFTPSQRDRAALEDVTNAPIIQLEDLIGDVGNLNIDNGGGKKDDLDDIFGSPASAPPQMSPPLQSTMTSGMPAATAQSNFGQNALASFSPSDGFGPGPSQSLLDMPSGNTDFGGNSFSDNQNPFASNQNDSNGLFGNSMPAASNLGMMGNNMGMGTAATYSNANMNMSSNMGVSMGLNSNMGMNNGMSMGAMGVNQGMMGMGMNQGMGGMGMGGMGMGMGGMNQSMGGMGMGMGGMNSAMGGMNSGMAMGMGMGGNPGASMMQSGMGMMNQGMQGNMGMNQGMGMGMGMGNLATVSPMGLQGSMQSRPKLGPRPGETMPNLEGTGDSLGGLGELVGGMMNSAKTQKK
uniref:ENTH domain-containing protein n=1 Tax=Hanusia phi TaxID=3032 RepID=A0A7S0HDG1_9CRYP